MVENQVDELYLEMLEHYTWLLEEYLFEVAKDLKLNKILET